LQPEVAARLVLKLAKAIQHAHKQGILHRDLKPSNILLEAPQPQTNSQDALEPEPKIADFGLAKKLDDDSSLTRTGDVFGSPSYMSPEQASGIGKLTPAVDVYALGAILYECLSGRPPFLGPDAMLTIMMVLSNDPVPPRQILPKLPADLETICLKCLEKQPRKRYASAGELAADLERYLGGEPILARPVGRLERFIKWSRRRPWQAASAGLALALLLGSVIGLLLLNSAYREAIRANEVSDQSFTISRDTVSDLLNQLSGELSLVPNMGKLTLKSYRQVVELFSRLHAIRPEDRSTALAYEEHLQGLVHQLVFQGRHDEALQFAIKLGELVQQERRKRVNDIDWRLAELRYAVSMGWLYRQMQLPEKAMPYDVQAMERLDSLKHEQPENIKLLHYSNELLRNAISDDIARLTAVETVAEKKALMDRVLQHHRDIIENCERTFAQVPEYQQAVALISSRRSLAMMLVALQQTEEAERLYHSIQESLKNIQFPEREQISFLVQTKTDLHELARQRLDWEQAAIHLKEAKEANHRLRVLYPDDGLYFHQEF
ncbi:MAG TPA: serine/threonine-protein kinase, partial [Gemmatales bacterium]|nr:serine/threonine-protein kinase [Gemmatales bacterium]